MSRRRGMACFNTKLTCMASLFVLLSVILYRLFCVILCVTSFTESLGNNVFTVQANQAADGLRTRTMMQVLDRHDGSYLVRYKLMQGYHDVVINVLFNGQHIANSPYALSGTIL